MIKSKAIMTMVIFILCSCASLTTTQLRPTATTRNMVTIDSTLASRFDTGRQASTTRSVLEIALEYTSRRHETYQRRHIEKRRLKPAVRVALWAAGAAVAGGGYYLYDHTGRSRLGELAMGAGGLIPLGGEIITASLPPVGEEWKQESRSLPPRTEPAVGVPVTVNALNSTWSDTTDEAGMVTVEVASLASSVPFGEPMEVQVVLQEDTASGTFTVPVEIVDAYRTPPVLAFAAAEAAGEEHLGRAELPVILSGPWHKDIRFSCLVAGSGQDDGNKKGRTLGPFVIPAGETDGVVSLPVRDDDIDEKADTITFILEDPDNATLGARTTSSYIILDDDEPPLVQFAAATSRSDESVSPGRLVVSLSNPSGWDIHANYAVKGGTAEGQGVDYYLDSGTVAIPAGAATATIEVPIIDDAQSEGEESIVISLSNPLHTTLGEYATHTYIIADNDEVTPVAPVAAATPPVELPSSASELTIAILDFEGIGVSAEEARVLTNRLGTHMVQLGRYQVIERGQMEQILTEQDFQLTGCTSNECAVEIGQLIGAQQMLAGSFGKLGSAYTIDMRIIDVLTGRITKTTSYDIEGSINRLLSEGLAEAVRRIAGVE